MPEAPRLHLRPSILAGRFYEDNPQRLASMVGQYLADGPKYAAPTRHKGSPWGFMLPHAGHVYCGRVAGATLAGAELPETLVILCPNHTGRGQAFGVWPDGVWLTPLGPVPVDAKLAGALIARQPFVADTLCHAGEHSIEVLLPFLQVLTKGKAPAIVPISLGTQNPEAITLAGRVLAQVLGEAPAGKIGVLVSSDMNHYEDEATTLKKDNLALEHALACDPRALLETTRREHITMCGAGPLALALTAMQTMGGAEVEFVCHDTSGTASGDRAKVVGYAGLRLFVDRGA